MGLAVLYRLVGCCMTTGDCLAFPLDLMAMCPEFIVLCWVWLLENVQCGIKGIECLTSHCKYTG